MTQAPATDVTSDQWNRRTPGSQTFTRDPDRGEDAVIMACAPFKGQASIRFSSSPVVGSKKTSMFVPSSVP